MPVIECSATPLAIEANQKTKIKDLIKILSMKRVSLKTHQEITQRNYCGLGKATGVAAVD